MFSALPSAVCLRRSGSGALHLTQHNCLVFVNSLRRGLQYCVYKGTAAVCLHVVLSLREACSVFWASGAAQGRFKMKTKELVDHSSNVDLVV